MAKDTRSGAVLSQECYVDKATGKVIEASKNKIRLTKLPKPPEGTEIDQVEIIIHTCPRAANDPADES
ncbi:MAG: hypothetical protein AAF543_08110 [Pseudomonadota bacterium]